MAARNWCVTNLTAPDALVLTIGEYQFPVVQFVSSFAINEIPTASCMVAVGRDARSSGAGTPASPHAVFNKLLSMQSAVVTARPLGDASPTTSWTGSSEVLFDGLYVGSGLRCVYGKIYLVFHIVHWLVQLGFSSSLSANSSSSNPASLTDPAISSRGKEVSDTGSSVSYYLPDHVRHAIVEEELESDLWVGIKNLFCAVAKQERMNTGCAESCGTTFKENTPALAALKRIEGRGTCGGDSNDYHVPLKIANAAGVPEIRQSVAAAVQEQTLEAWAQATFWDVLVGQLCPLFNMAVIPRVLTAIVAADTPSFRGVYKTIDASEQDAFDFNGMLQRPLGAVSVLGHFTSSCGTAETQGKSDTAAADSCTGGCYFPDNAGTMLKGAAQYVAAPIWLSQVPAVTSPQTGEAPVPTGTTPGVKGEAPSDKTYYGKVAALYKDYARSVYVAEALRGRSGPFSGPLRFDISPGSIVRVRARAEQFLNGSDALAVEIVGSVNRVTIAINAEANAASTSFQLTHVRTAAENEDDRTSTDSHPLFGSRIFNGAPLIDAWKDS